MQKPKFIYRYRSAITGKFIRKASAMRWPKKSLLSKIDITLGNYSLEFPVKYIPKRNRP